MLRQKTKTAARDPASPGEGSFYAQNWPYVIMMVLALFGVAATSVARRAMTDYWIVLAPVFAALSILLQHRNSNARQIDWRVVGNEILHWGAVLVAMLLVFIGDVRRIMNADASALMVLTVLALGTFTAGLHGAWRMCLIGVALALGVPLIAWIDEATLLLLLLAVLLMAFMAALFLTGGRTAKKAG